MSIKKDPVKFSMHLVLFLTSFVALAPAARAQSPNTSAIVVVVTDQSGGVITDANVRVTNDQTGAVREATSGSDGSTSFAALSLTGTYTVNVSKTGE